MGGIHQAWVAEEAAPNKFYIFTEVNGKAMYLTADCDRMMDQQSIDDRGISRWVCIHNKARTHEPWMIEPTSDGKVHIYTEGLGRKLYLTGDCDRNMDVRSIESFDVSRWVCAHDVAHQFVP